MSFLKGEPREPSYGAREGPGEKPRSLKRLVKVKGLLKGSKYKEEDQFKKRRYTWKAGSRSRADGPNCC